MNTNMWVEVATHVGLIVVYAASCLAAFSALRHADDVARKQSTLILLVVSAAWLFFYLFISPLHPRMVTSSVLWSRALHYITGSACLWLALLIRDSEIMRKEAVDEARNGNGD